MPKQNHEWVICGTCDGDGKHSRHLGAFTMDEFQEHFPDEDDQQRYFNGAYDRPCSDCNGQGLVERPKEGTEGYEEWIEGLRVQREIDNEEKWERRMLGEY